METNKKNWDDGREEIPVKGKSKSRDVEAGNVVYSEKPGSTEGSSLCLMWDPQILLYITVGILLKIIISKLHVSNSTYSQCGCRLETAFLTSMSKSFLHIWEQ